MNNLKSLLERKIEEINEIPEYLSPIFSSLRAYQLSEGLRDINDDLNIGDFFRSKSIDPETPVFRGTDLERFRDSEKIEIWWTYNLRKAINYANKNKDPIVLSGDTKSLYSFKDVYYLDDSILIASKEQYKGNRLAKPIMRIQKSRITAIQILSHLKEIN